MSITIPASPPLFVHWRCRRCGHTGGYARTTIPVTADWNEAMMRALFDSLRRKLVKIHLKQGCVACVDDFVIARGAPEDKTVVGVL